MTNPIRCSCYIFDEFSDACAVMEILNVRYPNLFITATTGRLLSVGVASVKDVIDVDGLIVQLWAEVQAGR
jgi:hypothetical protein